MTRLTRKLAATIKQLGISQAKAARQIGCSQKVLNNWCRGRVRPGREYSEEINRWLHRLPIFESPYFQNGIAEERTEDLIIRLCAAGRSAEIDTIHRGKQILRRLIRQGRIVRTGQAGTMYVPTCPHCGEPFLDVMGAPH
jgi:transcriptional regulator with XRE-family HTH domain